MKILEAWAWIMPVVATPETAAGLEIEDLREVLIARDGAGFAGETARPLAARRAASTTTRMSNSL
jgi:hypothetical protein